MAGPSTRTQRGTRAVLGAGRATSALHSCSHTGQSTRVRTAPPRLHPCPAPCRTPEQQARCRGLAQASREAPSRNPGCPPHSPQGAPLCLLDRGPRRPLLQRRLGPRALGSPVGAAAQRPAPPTMPPAVPMEHPGSQWPRCGEGAVACAETQHTQWLPPPTRAACPERGETGSSQGHFPEASGAHEEEAVALQGLAWG